MDILYIIIILHKTEKTIKGKEIDIIFIYLKSDRHSVSALSCTHMLQNISLVTPQILHQSSKEDVKISKQDFSKCCVVTLQ